MEYAQTKAPSNVEEIPTRSEDAYRSMRAAMDEYVASATEMAREACAYADRQVHQNPWTAVGVGFGVGVAFGALVAMVSRGR